MDTALTRRTLMRRAGTGLAAAAAGSALLPTAPAFGATPEATRSRLTGPLTLQMQAIADAAQMGHPLPIQTLSPDNARAQPSPRDAVEAVLAQQNGPHIVEPVGNVQHITFPGLGGPILARVYTPAVPGPYPVMVYFHGGGWVVYNLDTYDTSCRALCNAAGAVVMSVNYRLAPEHKFPAAAEDAYAATQWAIANAAAFGGVPSRVAVVGESAGGNLAAVAALMSRDRHGAMPNHQALVYPITNYAFNTPSYLQNATDAPFLTRAAMIWFWQQYLRTPADGANPYASPLRASSLSGLPPATIINGNDDVLRSDGEEYAARLRQANVPTTRTLYTGVSHEFFSMSIALLPARLAVAEVAAAIKSAAPTGKG